MSYCVSIIHSKNRLSDLFNFNRAFPKNFVPTLFTNFCVVIATLLIMVELNATLVSGEHVSLSVLTGKRVNSSKKSAVKEDKCLFFKHMGSFEGFSTLDV